MKPDIKVHISNDDGEQWLSCTVNGWSIDPRIYTLPAASANVMAKRLETMVSRAYEMGYKRGQRECQKAIRDAIGYSDQ